MTVYVNGKLEELTLVDPATSQDCSNDFFGPYSDSYKPIHAEDISDEVYENYSGSFGVCAYEMTEDDFEWWRDVIEKQQKINDLLYWDADDDVKNAYHEYMPNHSPDDLGDYVDECLEHLQELLADAVE